MYQSTEQAISALETSSLKELEREQAARYLRDHPSDEGIDALIRALERNDYGVRWVAAECLAALGQKALPALLAALVQPDHSVRLREGAHHILKNNASFTVRAQAQAVVEALESQEPEIATMTAARRLLDQVSG